MDRNSQPPAVVISEFELDPGSIEAITSGHINLSFAARRPDGEPLILQRVNPIFPAAINDDIEAVTSHLAGLGITTARLQRTRSGSLYLEAEDGVWRLQNRIAGSTHESITSEKEAAEAARVLGEFHTGLSDFSQPLRSTRPPVHNLPRHLEFLRQTLGSGTEHQAHTAVAAIADQLFELAASIGQPAAGPERLVHGDPKISNVVFDQGRAVCLIDLDTITRMPPTLELGDAFRSWCNLAAEDSADASFSTERFGAAIEAYAGSAAGFLIADEWQSVPAATLGIAVELAARFAADALNESYFGWDSKRFASASEHNQARALAQLRLAESLRDALPTLDRLIAPMTRL